jgi:hypothetical protein
LEISATNRSLQRSACSDWYGVSEDSAEEGLRELRQKDLLSIDKRWIPAARSKKGWTEQYRYALEGPFSQEEREKSANYRGEAVSDLDDELDLDEI